MNNIFEIELKLNTYLYLIFFISIIYFLLPAPFCLLYSTFLGKFLLVSSVMWLCISNLIAGLISVWLLIIIAERCHNLVIENFSLTETSNDNKKINMQPIVSPDDFRKRVCLKGYTNIPYIDSSGNPIKDLSGNIMTNTAWLFSDPFNNTDFYKNVLIPFFSGKKKDKIKIIDLDSITEENGCKKYTNPLIKNNEMLKNISDLCDPICNWKVKDSPKE